MQINLRWLLVLIAALSATTASARSSCPSAVGRWGYGPSIAVASFEDKVYFGSGIFLKVAEIRSGPEIEVLAELELPNIIMDMEIQDGLAAIAATDSGLLLVDVNDPASPTLIGRLDTPYSADRVALAGEIALIADHHGGLRIVDIQDPSAPREVSSVDFGRPVLEVAAIGNYAYVAVNHSIQIIDISRPSVPTVVGAFQHNTIVNAITIHQGLAYIGTNYRGLTIFDAGEPTNPVWLGEYDPMESSYYAVVVHDDRVYLGYVGLTAVDVSDPTEPELISYLGPGSVGNAIRGLAMHGDLLLTATEGDGLRLIDTSYGSGLSEVGSYDVPGEGDRLAVAGTTIYLGSRGERGDGIRVFDAARSSDPVLLGATRNLQWADSIQDLAVADDILYFVFLLTAVDVADPTAPYGAAYIGDRTRAIKVSSGHLFAITDSLTDPSALRVYDLSEPLAPVLVGNVPVPGSCTDLDMDGDLAIVVSADEVDDPTGGLHIFDVSNPAEPTPIGAFETPTLARAVAVQDSMAFIAESGVLRIVDISSPSQPRQMGVIRLNAEWPTAVDVAVSGGVAFVVDAGHDFVHQQYVHIIDVSDPEAPRQRSRLQIDTTDIEAADGLFYIADQAGGFRIIDPNTPCREPFVHEIPASLPD